MQQNSGGFLSKKYLFIQNILSNDAPFNNKKSIIQDFWSVFI